MRKSRKYRPKQFTWGIVGRLAGSTCSHIVGISRERAKQLLKSHTGSRRERYRNGSREWNLPFQSTKDMSPGYTFSEMYVYAVRG